MPEKVGLKGIQRDGLEYDFTLVFDIDIKHNATASKDRTGLFVGNPEQKITIVTGEQIRAWCNSGIEINVNHVSTRIADCLSLNELLQVYKQYPQFKIVLQPEYEQKKRELIIKQEVLTQLENHPISANGTGH